MLHSQNADVMFLKFGIQTEFGLVSDQRELSIVMLIKAIPEVGGREDMLLLFIRCFPLSSGNKCPDRLL